MRAPTPLQRPLGFGLGLAALIVLLDQATKYVMFAVVQPPFGGLEITGFFNLVRVWNRGVSFGLFASGSPWTPVLLSALALAVAGALTWWLSRADSRRLVWALGLIIGGALGNAIDRTLYGAVMDFIDLHWAGYHWPAFNVADSAISIGAVLLVWDALSGGGKSHKQADRDPKRRP